MFGKNISLTMVLLPMFLLIIIPLGFAHMDDDLGNEKHNDFEAMQKHLDKMHSTVDSEHYCPMMSNHDTGYRMYNRIGYSFIAFGWIGTLLHIIFGF